jgi:hypothetical protein
LYHRVDCTEVLTGDPADRVTAHVAFGTRSLDGRTILGSVGNILVFRGLVFRSHAKCIICNLHPWLQQTCCCIEQYLELRYQGLVLLRKVSSARS